MLQNWFRRFLSIFQKRKTSPPLPTPTTTDCDLTKVKSVVVPLIRTDEQIENYKQWLQTRACTNWLQFFKEQYNNYNCRCKLAPCDNRLSFNIGKCTRGFVLKFDENIHNQQDFQHLFDSFSQAFIKSGYSLQAADLRTYACPSEKKETIERYYLKPPTNCLNQGKIEQCFGNITLTLHARGNTTMYLQCRAAHYRDMTIFQPPFSLSKMVACLTIKGL